MWKSVLLMACKKLLREHWEDVVFVVQGLSKESIPGSAKRELAIQRLRSLGVEVATWLLSAAIEVAYGVQVDAAPAQ